MKYSAYILAGLIASVAFVPAVNAATADSSMTVSMTVANSCTVATSPIALGTYDRSTGAEATSSIDVTCTSGTEYKVSIAEPEGGFFLKSGSNSIPFSLLDSSGEAFPSSADLITTPRTAGESASSISVKASVASGINKPAGSYAATVTVLVTYE